MAVNPIGEVWDEMERFRERFGETVPLQMIPSNETNQGLIDKIRRCLKEDKNLLPELYKWKYDGSIIY